VNLSLGEYRALVAKAFRGAGYPWGLTEEAGFAAKRLAEFDLPSGEIVVRLLQAIDGAAISDVMPTSEWSSPDTILCPVCVGAAIADHDGSDALAVSQVLEPLLAIPFLMLTLPSESSHGYVMSWAGGACQLNAHAAQLEGNVPTGPVDVAISRGDIALAPTTLRARIDLALDTMTELERFARRTYAPATEASRNAGAGE